VAIHLGEGVSKDFRSDFSYFDVAIHLGEGVSKDFRSVFSYFDVSPPACS